MRIVIKNLGNTVLDVIYKSTLENLPLRSRKSTGMWGSIPDGGHQSAGAPGIPDPGAGTSTVFRSSVKLT